MLFKVLLPMTVMATLSLDGSGYGAQPVSAPAKNL
jgi:hypothetical protein